METRKGGKIHGQEENHHAQGAGTVKSRGGATDKTRP